MTSNAGLARTYGVLTLARKARGARMERELERLLQAQRELQIALQQAQETESGAARDLRAFTRQWRESMSLPKAVTVDSILRARLKREALLAELENASAATARAHAELGAGQEACSDARRRLAANGVQVESLAGLRDGARAAVALSVEDAEEEESAEVHASRAAPSGSLA
ncbi:MAG: hypothetical protein EOO28_25335 [Comamonadaceae bacterium]|nr:MAG: hypothetical protein EOO28_25335 [Comamonadaceae bacterium]